MCASRINFNIIVIHWVVHINVITCSLAVLP